MKLAISKTVVLSDEQAIINGEKMLARDIKVLFERAIDDLAEGKTVNLAQYGIDEKLKAILSTPEARARAQELLNERGSTLRGWQTMAREELKRFTWDEQNPMHFGRTNEQDPDGTFLTEEDAAYTAGPGTFELPEEAHGEPGKHCKRCTAPMEEAQVGQCEGCTQPLCENCRALDVDDYIRDNGPMPEIIRGGVAGVKLPYLCSACMTAAVDGA